MTVGWGRPFGEPIDIAGPKLATLRDAGEYIAALPKKEHNAPEWQAAWKRCYWSPSAAARRCLPASCGH